MTFIPSLYGYVITLCMKVTVFYSGTAYYSVYDGINVLIPSFCAGPVNINDGSSSNLLQLHEAHQATSHCL